MKLAIQAFFCLILGGCCIPKSEDPKLLSEDCAVLAKALLKYCSETGRSPENTKVRDLVAMGYLPFNDGIYSDKLCIFANRKSFDKSPYDFYIKSERDIDGLRIIGYRGRSMTEPEFDHDVNYFAAKLLKHDL